MALPAVLSLACRVPEGDRTTTSTSIVEGRTTFHAGDTLTLRAEVTPAPPESGEPGVVFVVPPALGTGAPAEALVDGIAEHAFVCGSAEVPFGSDFAGARFLGTERHDASESGLSFECLP